MAVRRSSQAQANVRATPRRSQEELRRSIKMARMGYWITHSADPAFVWLSSELATFYELETRDGLVPVGKIRALFEPACHNILTAHHNACWDDGSAYTVQAQFRKPDGATIDCLVHGEALRDAQGRVRQVSGIVRDVTEETTTLRRLAESEQRLADFVSTASDWCWQSNAEHRMLPYPRMLDGNAAFQTVATGGKARWELSYAPEDEAAMRRHRADMEARRPFRDFSYTLIGDDGSRVSIRTSGKPCFAEDGTFLGYRGTASDVTELRATEAMLEQRTQALQEAHWLGRIGTWNFRLDTGRLVWAPELYSLFGFEPDTFEPTPENVQHCFVGEDSDRFWAMQRRVLLSGRTEALDVRVRHADGSARDHAVTCKASMSHGRIVGLVGTVQDVTERKEAERRLEQLAYGDPLTGLANRTLLKQRLAAMIETCTSQGRRGALLLIDLDRFKEVNDFLGHAAGDELLTWVATTLRREFGEATVARLGGDEFAVLYEGSATAADLMAVAKRIIGSLSGPVDLSEGEAFIGATIGIARLPEHGSTVEAAMRSADQALYMAKEAGRGRATLFEPAYAKAVELKLDLRRHLRNAVHTGALHAQYQPQVDLRSGRVTGFEALLRWTHPERGPISPAEFIPIAENSGLIVDLGLWVLREACRQGREWLDAGLPRRSVSVNVSPAQLWSMDFEKAVASVLAETNLPPDLLCLELTENLFVDSNEAHISRALTALSALGVRLALDDFGSGYSSLGYLTRLPFKQLKIDRVFVDGISTMPEKRKLLGGIVALSRGLGMTVVAEGAELPAEVLILGQQDCDVVQGYVFSPPVVADKAPSVAAAIERDALVRRASLSGAWASSARTMTDRETRAGPMDRDADAHVRRAVL